MKYDLAIINGEIVDGSQRPRYKANIGINNGRIETITTNEISGHRSIDARGLIVAPGFIDVHSHGDFMPLLKEEYKFSRLKQGITMEIVGQCGISPIPFNKERMSSYKSYIEPVIGKIKGCWDFWDLESYERKIKGKMPHNMGYLIGLGALRSNICGLEAKCLTPQEIEEMGRLYETQLEQGAFGLSMGLSYLPGVYAKQEELLKLAEVTARNGAIIMAHIRSHGKDMLHAMEEYIDLSKKTGCNIHISHCRSFKNKDFGVTAREILDLADKARSEGVPLTLDQHPYTTGSTFLNQLLPPEYRDYTIYTDNKLLREIESKITDPCYKLPGWDNFSLMVGFDNIYIPEYEGTISELAQKAGVTDFMMLIDILIKEKGNASMVVQEMFSIEDTALLLKDSKTFVGSDGLPSGRPHPRLYGAFPKVVDTYVRGIGALTLEEAVYKMTGGSLVGLKDRGEVQEGWIADLTIFDPIRFRHEETYTGKNNDPEGVCFVLLKGDIVYDGKNIQKNIGEIIKREVRNA